MNKAKFEDILREKGIPVYANVRDSMYPQTNEKGF